MTAHRASSRGQHNPLPGIGRVLHAKRLRYYHLEACRRRLGFLDPEAEQERRELKRYFDWADASEARSGMGRLQ